MKRHLPRKGWALILVWLGMALAAQAQKEDFWQKTEGPYGVALWASLVTQNGTYYGGSDIGEIYRKLPGSDRWEIVQTTEGSTVLAFYERNGVVYAGGASLIYSDDNGDTWHQVEGFPTGAQVRYVIENKLGELLVATDDGIYRQAVGKDGATTWQRKSLSTQWGSFAFTLALDPATGTVYAGAGRGAYRSDDNGDTWTSIGLDDSPNSVMALGVSAAGDIYAGTSEGLLIHRAADPDPKGWVPTSNDDVSSTQVRRVSILNGNEIFVSVTSMGLYRSANNGADWERLLMVDSRAGTYHDPVTNQIITGTSQGVWASQPASTGPMEYHQIGIPVDVNRIYSYQSKTVVLADRNRGIYYSEDQGETWTRKFRNGEGVVTCFAERENQDIFIGCDGGFNGTPWIQAEIFIEFEGQRGWWSIGFPSVVTVISDVLITSKDSVYVGTDAGLYYIDSKEYGAKRRSMINSTVTILALMEDHAGNIYAATDEGIYISADDGVTWPRHLLENARVLELTLDGDHVLAATSQGLYDIAPDGTTTQLAVGTPGTVTSVTADDHGHVYATADDGVYHADSRTAAWSANPSGVEEYHYRGLRTIDNAAYLATDLGLYKHIYAGQAQINLSGLGAFDFNGAARTAAVTTVPANLPVTVLYNGQETPPVQGGTYQVTAIIQDEQYAGRKKGRITINKIAANVSLSGLGTYYYNGNPFAATATTNPAGLPVTIRYNNKNVVPVEIGEYYVSATVNHPSYYGSAGGDIVIQDAIMGTEDPQNKLVKIYPVPSRKGITIESGVDKIRSIAVYNTLGKLVNDVSFATPVDRHELETAAYPAGVLVVMITTDKHNRVVKRAELIR